MAQPNTFDLERVFFMDSDILDLHFAVLEAVMEFLEEYKGGDSRRLAVALRISYEFVSQRYRE